MKLLLTSAGVSNPTIRRALEKLLGKSVVGVSLAFIPTAANIESGDKSWMIDDLNNLRTAGFTVDIVDISAVPKSIWLPRLQAAQVIFLGGGNSFHLMRWVNESGLINELPELLKTRVYAGISAGSCIAGPTILNSVQNLFDEEYEFEVKNGLGLVDFQFVPHLNSPFFEKIREEDIVNAAKNVQEPVYVLDDNSALVIDGASLEVVSEGQWLKCNA